MVQKKKIAIIKSDLAKRGGIEKYTFRLAENFAKEGHEVFLLTTDCHVENIPPFQIVNLGKRCKSSFLHLLCFDKKCKKWLSEHPVDAVLGLDRNYCLQTHYRAGNGVHAAYLEHRKAFSSFFKKLSFKFNPQHLLILDMEKKTFESPHLKTLFTNSNMVKEEILHYYPSVPQDKINVVHNGVEWYELEKPFNESISNRDVIQKELRLDPEAYQFLFIGNEYQRKGLDLLLEALSTLKEKNFQLAVVGKERNMEKFLKLAAAHDLQNKVLFFGPQARVTQFYQAADAFVIPSYYDPFANVTVEALAMGLYVISSPKNGGSEVIKDDTMGLQFSEYTAKSLARCLEMAMAKPKTEESAQYIRNAVRGLDFSKQIKKIVDLIF